MPWYDEVATRAMEAMRAMKAREVELVRWRSVGQLSVCVELRSTLQCLHSDAREVKEPVLCTEID